LVGKLEAIRNGLVFATAGDDPHDWRKGCEIAKTQLDELSSELATVDPAYGNCMVAGCYLRLPHSHKSGT